MDEITMRDETMHPDLQTTQSFTNYSHQYKKKQIKNLEYNSLKTFKNENNIETEVIKQRKKQLLDKALDEKPELRDLVGHWDRKIDDATPDQPSFSKKKFIASEGNYSLKLGTVMPKRPSIFT